MLGSDGIMENISIYGAPKSDIPDMVANILRRPHARMIFAELYVNDRIACLPALILDRG